MNFYKAYKCTHIQNRWSGLLFYTGTNSSIIMDAWMQKFRCNFVIYIISVATVSTSKFLHSSSCNRKNMYICKR